MHACRTDAFNSTWDLGGTDGDGTAAPRLDSMHMHSLAPLSGSPSGIAHRLSSRIPTLSNTPSRGAGGPGGVAPGRGGGKVRIVQAGPGALLGALDYTLGRRRSFQCLVTADADMLRLTREAHRRMARHDPAAMAALQQVMLRSALTTTAHAMAMFERVTQQ